MDSPLRIALTGFMGVGKSSVSRHLAHILKCRRVDLDNFIEKAAGRSIAELIDADGIDEFRRLETDCLKRLAADNTVRILSLGGGTFTLEQNRGLLHENQFTSVWLESSFEHCWMNITHSKKERPLARDKESAKRLFDERQKIYCLAEWHFVVRPGLDSSDIARQIADEIFS